MTARSDLSGALGDFDRAIHLNPRYRKAYERRAFVRELKSDPTGARADRTKAASIAKAAQSDASSQSAPTATQNADDDSADNDASNPKNTLPINAKIFVARSNGFETYLEEALRKKNVPVVIVTDKGDADYEIIAGYNAPKGSWAMGGGDRFPVPGKETPDAKGHLSVIKIRTGVRVWDTRAAVGRGWFTRNFQRRLAEKLIEAFKARIDTNPKR